MSATNPAGLETMTCRAGLNCSDDEQLLYTSDEYDIAMFGPIFSRINLYNMANNAAPAILSLHQFPGMLSRKIFGAPRMKTPTSSESV
jgi:hypothetical protein